MSLNRERIPFEYWRDGAHEDSRWSTTTQVMGDWLPYIIRNFTIGIRPASPDCWILRPRNPEESTYIVRWSGALQSAVLFSLAIQLQNAGNKNI